MPCLQLSGNFGKTVPKRQERSTAGYTLTGGFDRVKAAGEGRTMREEKMGEEEEEGMGGVEGDGRERRVAKMKVCFLVAPVFSLLTGFRIQLQWQR